MKQLKQERALTGKSYGLLADLEAEIEKTIAEHDRRLDEVRKAVQSTLWPQY